MQILFHCRHCFAECRTTPQGKELIPCPRCKKPLALHCSNTLRDRNLVDTCALCQQQDFYVRDEARKALGLLYLLLGLAAAYWTYGISLLLGGYGFYCTSSNSPN